MTPRRGTAALALALALVAALVAGCGGGTHTRVVAAVPAAGGSLDAYRGLGAWIDIYDSTWHDPAGTVAAMKAQGVRTLFMETSNYKHARAFVHAQGVRAFVDAAHQNHMKVVAWYLPGLRNLPSDGSKSRAAIAYTTPSGNSFDSFALDIESSLVSNVNRRNQRLLTLSDRLRRFAGASYPMGAIIPSPVGIAKNPTYWPNFPYQELAQRYEVILPMSYWTFRVHGSQRAHDYIAQNIRMLRAQVGNAQEPIHVIGGVLQDANAAETRGFVHAVREFGVIGASPYSWPGVTKAEQPLLRLIPANPVQRPAMPIPLSDPQALGNIPSGDHSHPKEVVYGIGKRSGAARLSFDAFDVQKGEVKIYVNWRLLGPVAAGRAHRWTGVRRRTIPTGWLHASRLNYVEFVAAGSAPSWSTWGVRTVQLAGG